MKTTMAFCVTLCLFGSTFALACGPDDFSKGIAGGGGFKGDFSRFAGGFHPSTVAARKSLAQHQMLAAARQQFALRAAERRARMKPIRMAKAAQKRQEVLAQRAAVRADVLARKETRQREEQAFLASARTWVDRTGKYEVQAQLVAHEDHGVTLKRLDGTMVTVPLTKLSLGDIAWVRAELNLPRSFDVGTSLLAAR